MRYSAVQVMRIGVGGLVILEVLAFWRQRQWGLELSQEIAVGLLLTAVMVWLLVEVLQALAGKLPFSVPLAAGAALVVDGVGNLLGWYVRYGWYDNVVHFFSGLVVGVVMMMFFETLQRRRGWRVSRGVWVYASWASAAVAGIGFEIVEFSLDYLAGEERWLGSGRDTVADLVFGMVGAAAVAVREWAVIKSAAEQIISGGYQKGLKSVTSFKLW